MRIERDWSPSSEEEVRKAIKWWTEEPKGEQEWAGVKFRGSDNTQYRFDKAKCMKEVDIDPSLEIGENNTRGWTEEQLKRVWEIARDTVKQLHQEISVYEKGVDHHETGSESSSQV